MIRSAGFGGKTTAMYIHLPSDANITVSVDFAEPIPLYKFIVENYEADPDQLTNEDVESIRNLPVNGVVSVGMVGIQRRS